MIDDLSVLGLIPARGGSKGLPRKNIRELHGKPLLGWTVEAARNSRYIDRLVLSTDDPDIADVGRALDCEVPFRRPDSLASDTATSAAVLEHAVGELPGYDVAVLLQPTSPLRATEDIDACVEMWRESDAETCVSITEAPEPPQWLFYRAEDGRLSRACDTLPEVEARQEARDAYVLNGAVYVVSVPWFLGEGSLLSEDAIGYRMPTERSVDIDTRFDLQLAELMLT